MQDYTGYCSDSRCGNLLASTKWSVDKRVPIPNHEYIRFANDVLMVDAPPTLSYPVRTFATPRDVA